MFRRKETPFFAAFRDADPNGPVTVHIDPDRIESPDHAGLMMADFARHLSRAMAQSGKADDEREALMRLLVMFEAELRNPTDEIVGGVQH